MLASSAQQTLMTIAAKGRFDVGRPARGNASDEKS